MAENEATGFREVTWEWATTRQGAAGFVEIDDPVFMDACLARLEDAVNFPHVEGIILFRNVDLSSSQLGAQSVMPYGPENSIKTTDLPDIRQNGMQWRLGDVPSRFQYPQWYISRENHLKAKKGA